MLPLIADKTISVEVKREDSRWSVSSYKPGNLDEVRFAFFSIARFSNI